MSKKHHLSDLDVAVELNCGRSTVWRWAANGIIPKPVKFGGISRWAWSDIEAVITQAKQKREIK